MKQEKIQSLFKKHGYTEYKWIHPKEIVVSHWVRMKCLFGCDEYGKTASCPPNLPTVPECQHFFNEYTQGVVFHFEQKMDNPEDRHKWSRGINKGLLKLERNVFLMGYPKAFLLFMDSCNLCNKCPGHREECKHPKESRPSPEGMAVDVFTTAQKIGYPIEVLSDYTKTMNRYAILLIE